MINELQKEESKLKEELESLKKHSNAIHMKLIRLDKWLQRNNYHKPYVGNSDLNIVKYHRLVYDLSQVDIEINDVLAQIKETKHDIYYMYMGFLISAYKGNRFKVVQIDNNNKAIEEIYCNDYNTYLGHDGVMILVYELIRGINKLPYEKLIHIKEDE